MDLKVHVFGNIRGSVSDVFDAVYNPKKLSGYFTTKGASAPLDAGKTVTWEFADFPGPFPVVGKKMEKDRVIAFEWESPDCGPTLVEFRFERIDDAYTKVEIFETGWRETNQKTIDDCVGKSMGWMQMLCCLRVYVEEGGRNFRHGFFKVAH